MERDKEGPHCLGKKRFRWSVGIRDVVCIPGQSHHFFVGTPPSKPGSNFPIADTMGSPLGTVVPTFFVTAEEHH